MDKVLTYSCFTELLSRHLIGNVCPHQHTHINTHLLPDDVGYQLETLRSFIYTL